MPYLQLVVAILFEVAGTTALKASDGFTRLWPALGTILCYGGSFYFLALTLRAIPLAVAYAIWSGVGIVLLALMGWLQFREPLDAPAMLGIGLILAGVVVLNVFSRTAGH